MRTQIGPWLTFWVKIVVILWICSALQAVLSFSAWEKSRDSTPNSQKLEDMYSTKIDLWGFHLYLLVFPFVYQFYSIIEALVSSSFANDEFRRISVSFQHHFKIYLLWLLHEKECSFYSYLFCCTEMTWMFIISTTIWVNGWDTSSVASRARSELTSS